MRRPSTPQIGSSQKGPGIPFAHVGTVVDAPAGSNRIRVRMGNESAHALENVTVGSDVQFQSGDRVLMINVPDEPRWIAVTRVMDTKEYGLLASKMLGEQELHPPNNFTMTGGVGLIIGEWDAFTGNTVCWEVEHNSSASATGASYLYTRGSYFLYPTAAAETRYARVRAVRYDVIHNNAYYSRYSTWLSATSTAATGSSGELPVVGSGGQPFFRVDGPLSAGTHVGGAYMFGAAGQIDSIMMHVKTTGTSGETKIDLNRHRGGGAASLWVTEAAKPSIAASDPDNTVIIVSNPNVSDIQTADKLTLDIDTAATGAVDLDVVVLMRGSSEEMAQHAHSGGPHTGQLAWSELQYNYGILWQDRRQGGDGSSYPIAGTTDYNITNPRIQTGSSTITVLGSSGTNPWKHKAQKTVTFPRSYTHTPLVFLTVHDSTDAADDYLNVNAEVKSVSTAGFTYYAGVTSDTDIQCEVLWMAIGHMA